MVRENTGFMCFVCPITRKIDNTKNSNTQNSKIVTWKIVIRKQIICNKLRTQNEKRD